MLPVRTIFQQEAPTAEVVFPPALRELYDGDLYLPRGYSDRPFVFGNFVTTLDGVVSYAIPGHSS